MLQVWAWSWVELYVFAVLWLLFSARSSVYVVQTGSLDLNERVLASCSNLKCKSFSNG
jgi:hypothetical protein